MVNWFRRALPALACLALTSCFLQPGKFDSTLDLRKNGTFTFSYKGQIYMLAHSELADLAGKTEAKRTFTPEPCHDADLNERKCTPSEIADQKRAWDDERKSKQADDQKNAEMMRTMLGGIDPADPAAAKELADRLRHQAGWRSVTYAGNGLFEVDFMLSSKLEHDFTFPTIERFPMANVFVMATRRVDGTVRVDAPGFSAQSPTNPMQGPMGGLLGAAAASNSVKSGATPAAPALDVPEIDGTFRIVSDGEILANNTDDGPQLAPGGKLLQWRVTKRSQVAPMALVRLAP